MEMVGKPSAAGVVSTASALRSAFCATDVTYVCPRFCRTYRVIGLDPGFQTMMMEMMRQNSRLIELMDRRLTVEEKRREEEEAARKAATTPYVGPINDPFAVGSSSSVGFPSALSSGFTGNRAEKYLPQIPILDHSKMGKSRMVEVEEWLRRFQCLACPD